MEKSVKISIEKIRNKEKAKQYKAEVEAQTKIEELKSQDTNNKKDAMVSIRPNAAKKSLEKDLN